MKTVGIIGGLGPETTSEFYLEIIFGCFSKNREVRPPILIWNVPLLYQIERDLLMKSEGEERYIPYLQDAARKLEKAGADFLVMPCNSLHIFIDEIRNSVSIPVLSILEETSSFLKKQKVKSVGILATSTLLKSGIYERTLKKQMIAQVKPDNYEQEKIGKVISNIVLNRHANKDREQLLKIIENLEKKKVRHVILACTDLQLLIPKNSKIKIYDTMKIFAEATVNKILE